ncbi:uncharacterized protein LOC132393823 [Hypanus sabinus]|uniref:uncharacterized protein LOC132393823 n=1 Tax=Hypanus sabinus TaxID=79690 RepID=UPI0028C3E324|nr:uncharacterized protein LOC132393823 [Hypanus sabinus]
MGVRKGARGGKQGGQGDAPRSGGGDPERQDQAEIHTRCWRNPAGQEASMEGTSLHSEISEVSPFTRKQVLPSTVISAAVTRISSISQYHCPAQPLGRFTEASELDTRHLFGTQQRREIDAVKTRGEQVNFMHADGAEDRINSRCVERRGSRVPTRSLTSGQRMRLGVNSRDDLLLQVRKQSVFIHAEPRECRGWKLEQWIVEGQRRLWMLESRATNKLLEEVSRSSSFSVLQ